MKTTPFDWCFSCTEETERETARIARLCGFKELKLMPQRNHQSKHFECNEHINCEDDLRSTRIIGGRSEKFSSKCSLKHSCDNSTRQERIIIDTVFLLAMVKAHGTQPWPHNHFVQDVISRRHVPLWSAPISTPVHKQPTTEEAEEHNVAFVRCRQGGH